MKLKVGCTPRRWERDATKAAKEAGVCPVAVLAGSSKRAHVAVRWNVWRNLAGRNFSYSSIGAACGFDHTSIRHACLLKRGPQQGRPVNEVANV